LFEDPQGVTEVLFSMESLLHLKVPVDLLIYFGIFALSGEYLRLRVLELDDPYIADPDEEFADNFMSEVEDGNLVDLWSLGISRSASRWVHEYDNIQVLLALHIHQIGQNAGPIHDITYVNDHYEPGVYQLEQHPGDPCLCAARSVQ
jgi:hypothetical protein